MAWHIVDEYAIALQRSIHAGFVRPPFNAAQHRLVRMFADTYKELCKLKEKYDRLEEEQLELDSYEVARANVDDYALALSDQYDLDIHGRLLTTLNPLQGCKRRSGLLPLTMVHIAAHALVTLHPSLNPNELVHRAQ